MFQPCQESVVVCCKIEPVSLNSAGPRVVTWKPGLPRKIFPRPSKQLLLPFNVGVETSRRLLESLAPQFLPQEAAKHELEVTEFWSAFSFCFAQSAPCGGCSLSRAHPSG